MTADDMIADDQPPFDRWNDPTPLSKSRAAMEAPPPGPRALDAGVSARRYRRIRQASRALCASLTEADATVQSMPETSPAKWHLAHTTWFFETLVLAPYLPGYRPFNARFEFLFNSYYESVGARHPRPLRGLLTRPDLETVQAYRDHVDSHIELLLEGVGERSVLDLIELGCQHEQQHQELILTDILHLFAQNPLNPSYREGPPAPAAGAVVGPAGFVGFEGGLIEMGHAGDGFAFDCEKPRHRVFIEPFRLADRAVTNGEWLEFIADGGYRNPLLWLSDGWALVGGENWTAPLYWHSCDGGFVAMSLRGSHPVDPPAPVVHISYFEADAFARWAGRRLPSEAEWEVAARTARPGGNFVESGLLRPAPAPAPGSASGLRQMFGDVWEWTRSAFAPYPRFQPLAGAAGEYNGKFMSGQFVLRGGSCVTPADHIRPSYRNFFPPHTRWQFSGLRLAEDA